MASTQSPSPHIRQKRRQVRQDILDSSLRILRAQGVDAVTLAAVAGDLGLTKQALYHYFQSKDALMGSLVTALLDAEIEALVAAITAETADGQVLGAMIRAFHAHHRNELGSFRLLYGQSQFAAAPQIGMDPGTIREQVNPRTRRLFDLLEARLAGRSRSQKKRRHLRQLAFTAWTSALGLLTMLSIAENTGDPLLHRDAELLETLAGVFDAAI